MAEAVTEGRTTRPPRTRTKTNPDNWRAKFADPSTMRMVARHLPKVPVRQTSIETMALLITLLAVATIVYYEAGAEFGFPRTSPEVEKGEPPLLSTDDMIQQAEKVMQDLTEGVECPPGSAPNGNMLEGDQNRVIDGFSTTETPRNR